MISQKEQRRVRDRKPRQRQTRSGVSFACLVLLVLPPGLAVAQGLPTPRDKGGDELSEVIVTAEKREESISRTPIALSALTQDQLTSQGIVDVTSLTSAVPNVALANNGLFANINMSIRGISSGDPNEDASSAVATYIDGVYVPRTQGLQTALYDLERVEVLRGPQGTLYGRNSSAGNINIVTAQPKQEFGASSDISFGNYGDVQAHGMVNVPVSGTLALRGSFVYHRNDGYFDTLGATVRDYGATDDRGGRLTALWRPVEQFRWRLAVEDFESSGTPNLAVATAPDGNPAGGYSPFQYPATSSLEPFLDIHNFSVRSRMEWDVSHDVSLTYLAGYQKLDYSLGADASGILDSFPALRNNNYSHEIDLNYSSQVLRNILGGNYFHEHTNEYSYYYIHNLDFALGTPAPDANTTAWGVFDQATYSVTPALRLTAGVRYSSERKTKVKDVLICPLDTPFSFGVYPPACTDSPVNTAGSWSSVTWKAGADYDVSDRSLAYLTITKGFRAGGANETSQAPSPDFNPNYNPETVINYEVGLKTHLLDDTLGLNVSLYDEEFRDIQNLVVIIVGPSIQAIVQNAGAARIYGSEIEANWRASPRDKINAFLTYNHATYTDFQNASDSLTGDIVPSLAGNSLPMAPKTSVRGEYTHDFPLPGGATLSPTASVYWQSDNYLRPLNRPIDRVPAYSKTDLRLTYADATARWKVEGYVHNLEDKVVRAGNYIAAATYFSYYYPPRTFGVRISYEY